MAEPKHVGSFLSALVSLEVKLQRVGFPALSPFWLDQLERFLRSGRKRWVVRVGRRGGKSSSLCRLAVAWALAGAWDVPRGDVAVIPFVSVDKTEASARLRTIGEILRALGVKFTERADEIEISGARPVLFRVRACTTTAAVGFTSVAIFADECALWESSDKAANPAGDVVGALTPTLATQPNGFIVMSSSPWGEDDFHHDCFAEGDTDYQVTSFAETWVANPSLTEQSTHEIQPDPRKWLRDFACVPGSTESNALDSDDVNAAFGLVPPTSYPSGRFIVLDPAELRGAGDRFTWGIFKEHAITGQLQLAECDGTNEVGFSAMVDRVMALGKQHQIKRIFSDNKEAPGLEKLFTAEGFEFVAYHWTVPSKMSAVELLRRALRERKLLLPQHAELRREMLGLRARLTPGEREVFDTGGRDFVSLLVGAFHAVADNKAVCKGALPSELTLADIPPDRWNQLEAALTAELSGSHFTDFGPGGRL